MKAAAFLFLLAVRCTVALAQIPSGDVTIGIFEGRPEYCLGPNPSPLLGGPNRARDDITLRLPLKLIYENHRPEKIIVPSWNHSITRMTVVGQTGSTALRDVRIGGMNVNTVMAMSSPTSVSR